MASYQPANPRSKQLNVLAIFYSGPATYIHLSKRVAVTSLDFVALYGNTGLVSPEPARKIAVYRGPSAKVRIVWGRAANGRFHGEEFYLKECTEDQRSKFQATFNLVADEGHCKLTKLYRYPLKGCANVGEFKTFKKRLFFFRSGNDLVLTHGATKKDDSTERSDIERVYRIEGEIKKQELAGSNSPTSRGKS